jgi:hypothetical protein
MSRIKIILIPLFSLLFITYTQAQYKISLSIPPFKNDTLLFGHYFNESLMLKDTFFTDNAGKAIIQGEEDLPGGMYTIFFPNKNRFDLLIDTDQEFSVSTDTSNILASTKITGSRDNEIFYNYLSFLDKKRNESSQTQLRIRTPISEQDSLAARKKLEEINKEVKTYVENIIETHPDLFVSAFLLSMKEVEVPEPPRDENGAILDSTFQVKYYKQHYFDYFDLSDVRLLRTPVYERKLKTYIDKWIYPVPDSIFKEVDWLISESRSDTLLFKYMLTTLFNHYATSKYVGMDAVYAYIAEKYYIPEATWSSPDFIEKLKERVEKISPLTIGKVSPDIRLVKVNDDHFMAAEQDTSLKRNPYIGDFFMLHDIAADYIILYFWEADCGHCKKSIPELYELWKEMKKEDIYVEIVAVNMLGGIEGKEKWVNFVNEYHLYGWVNAWNPYDFSYKEAFDVTSSNILYLLDKDKKIIAKRISPEQTEELIKRQLKN